MTQTACATEPAWSVYLRRIEPEQNIARFYAMQVDRDLFGRVVLVRQWGRLGLAGRTRLDEHPGEREAAAALAAIERTKRKRGYQG